MSFAQLSWDNFHEHFLLPACILLVALIAGIIINNIVHQRVKNHLSFDDDTPQYIFISALRGLPLFWCIGVGLYWTINSLELPPILVHLFSYILFGLIIFTFTRVIARTLSGLVDLHTQKNDKLPQTSLLTNIINIVIYLAGALIILEYCGISIAPIVTALGVGGMAVALGLQDTLANIFAGIHLILSKQLRPEDYIRLSSGEEGRVSDITWRFTTILANSGNAIIIPNKQIASSIITNYNIPQQALTITIPVSVSYDSDLDKVERVTLETARAVMQSIDNKIISAPVVRFHTFGESSIDFNVILYSSEFAHQFLLRHEFIKALTRRYRQENIIIPFPVRTILKGN